MKFYCPSCRVTFAVPDNKVPEGKGLKVLCPKCRIPIERKDDSGAPSAADETGIEENVIISQSYDMEEDDEESSTLEVFEEGAKTALLYLSETSRSEKMRQILRLLDYHVSVAGSAKVAINRLHKNRYDLVIVDEKVDGSQDSENLVLHHVKLVPMAMRRQFFLCLLSEDSPTLDQLLAFRLGVDMILNVQDLEKAKVILVRTMKEHKAFYKFFTTELERKG